MNKNPYAAPAAPLDGELPENEFGTIRSMHLRHESSVKSMGLLFLLAGGLSLLLAVLGVLVPTIATSVPQAGQSGLGILLLILVGTLLSATGYGLRQLRSWARISATLCSLLCLLIFPFGTMLSAYFLFLLLSQKANMVFSAPYQHVVKQTPHVVYRTSRLLLAIGLLLLILFFVLPMTRLLFDVS